LIKPSTKPVDGPFRAFGIHALVVDIARMQPAGIAGCARILDLGNGVAVRVRAAVDHSGIIRRPASEYQGLEC